MNDGKRTLSINAKEIHTIIHMGPRSPANPKKEVTKYFKHIYFTNLLIKYFN